MPGWRVLSSRPKFGRLPVPSQLAYSNVPSPRHCFTWNQSAYFEAGPFFFKSWNAKKPVPEWLKTPSRMIRMPRAWTSATSSRKKRSAAVQIQVAGSAVSFAAASACRSPARSGPKVGSTWW